MAMPDRYPAARLDALVDGVFGVAMTLLVLEIKLPPREVQGADHRVRLMF